MQFYRIIFLITLIYNCQYANPRLSIITPYTQQDDLSTFLYDISKQSYFPDVELILVTKENSSPFNEIVGYFMQLFPNIRLIQKEINSWGNIYNEAIRKSRALFFTIINIGDYRDPSMIESQLNALQNNESYDLVYSDFYVIYTQNGFKDSSTKWYFVNTPEFDARLIYSNFIGSHFIWRKSIHEKYGYFKDDFNYAFLGEFWNRCVTQGACFKKIDGVAGNFFLSYSSPKKIFFSQSDYEKSYQENAYIRETYRNHWSMHYDLPENHFVIVTASYNNKSWYKRNLDSILSQNYSNYSIIYVDDNSPDQTGQLVTDYIHEKKQNDKIRIIINEERMGATANIYKAIHLCDRESIIVIVDGDDELAHDEVLNHLNAIYQDPSVWLTYGQFQWFPYQVKGFTSELPPSVHEQNSVRRYGWVTSHLRTFRAGLYHKIRKEDLCYNGKFLEMTGDLAIMYAMIEMGGTHCRFIPEVLYIYNSANSLNDDKVDRSKQNHLGDYIARQNPYQPISTY